MMNVPIDTYIERITGLLARLKDDEKTNVAAAARLLRDHIAERKLIHVFGVGGHSVIGCEEFFWRAGGLAVVSPLFDQSLALCGGGLKSTMLERVPGVGDKVIAAAGLGVGDLLIITSIYGMNSATIDAALEARRRGVTLIAITSREHAGKTPRDFPARHPTGQNLHDLADVTIDNHVPYGDTVIVLEGAALPLGAVSTILVSTCVQWLVMETVELCLEADIPCPVWQSANTVGGDENNKALLREFGPRIKTL